MNEKLFAIDPGTSQSAFCLSTWDESQNRLVPIEFGILPNELLAERLRVSEKAFDVLAIEQIKSYGNVIGDTTLETCLWIGRFIEARFNADPIGRVELLPRKTITSIVCRNPRASDKNIRAAVIDLFGGASKAIGTKKAPGPLKMAVNDVWSAVAISWSYFELEREKTLVLLS